MKSKLQVLTEARKLIENRDAWIKGDSNRDKFGRPHLAGDPNAVQFCAYGALCHVAGDLSNDAIAWSEFREACGMDPIIFNDSHTHTEVLAAFDRAIAMLSEG